MTYICSCNIFLLVKQILVELKTFNWILLIAIGLKKLQEKSWSGWKVRTSLNFCIVSIIKVCND